MDSNSYCLILDNLEYYTKAIFEEPWSDTLKKHFYYNQKYYSENEFYEVTGILTTNYTPLVNITEIFNSKIAYLNGKINQFEYPYELTIKDFTKDERGKSDFYFPFVMAQSALKPIIAPQQIKEYSLASRILRSSNALVIIGYNINEDDNHVNSFIVDFLRRDPINNRVIFCKYTRAKETYDEAKCHKDICGRLRIAKNNEQLNVVENEGDASKLFFRISEIISRWN